MDPVGLRTWSIANKRKVEHYQTLVDFMISEYAQGRRTVLIVDEAQNMDADTLEELRVLSNINADKHQVLQLILVGQCELRNTLRRPELRQFAQRITVDYHLEPLEADERPGSTFAIASRSPAVIQTSSRTARWRSFISTVEVCRG